MSAIKKVLSFFLIIVILSFSFSSIAYAEKIDESLAKFEKISDNGSFILYANTDNGEIALKDKSNGFIWWSNPINKNEDKFAKGIFKTSLSSQIIVEYYDDIYKVNVVNNFINSVGEKTYKYKKVNNGIKFIYEFIKEGFVIPVQYILTDYGLKAEIVASEIQEKELSKKVEKRVNNQRVTETQKYQYKIMRISFLPYFGAGDNNTNGYMVVPDGSGALINFNNGKSKYPEFSMDVYGRDLTLSNRKFDNLEQVMMPVFGLKHEGHGFLSIITQGASEASISAFVSGQKTSYNNCYSIFNYRYADTLADTAAKGASKGLLMDIKSNYFDDNYIVDYHILKDNECDYNGMAKKYQSLLLKDNKLSKNIQSNKIPLYLELYGAIEVKKYFLGIPTNSVQPLTTFDDSRTILNALKDRGIDGILLKYNEWLNSNITGKVPNKADIERKLGGEKAFKNLIDYANKNGISIFPNVEFNNFIKSGNGVSKYFHSAKTFSNLPVLKYQYSPSTFGRNGNVPPYNLITIDKLQDIASKFFPDYAKYNNPQISLGSIGNVLYSNYGNRAIDRSQSMELIRDLLEELKNKKNQSVLLSSANDYCLKYISHVSDVSVGNSRFHIEDESIPFYQMVISGYLSYSTPSLNLSSDPDKLFLKALETGSTIKYTFTKEKPATIKETKLNNLFASDYEVWISDASKKYEILKSIFKDTSNMKLKSHEKLKNNVYRSRYENNINIIINYNDYPVSIDGALIKANSYSVKGSVK